MNLNFIKPPALVWLWRTSFVLVFLTLIALIILWSKLPPVIPFFYSLPWGEEQLAQSSTLVFFLLGSLLLFCLNTILSLFLEHVAPFIAKVLFIGTIGLCLMSVYTVVKILFLIT